MTCYFIQCIGSHVQHDCAIENAAPQFEQTVQRQGSHIRFAPPIPAIFNIFFKLQPSKAKIFITCLNTNKSLYFLYIADYNL